MTDHPVANTDRELYREPTPDGGLPGMDYYQPSIHVTQAGTIGMSVGGRIIVRRIVDWHWAASVADAVAQRTCLDCGHQWSMHDLWVGDEQHVPPGCGWPGCSCHKPRQAAR